MAQSSATPGKTSGSKQPTGSTKLNAIQLHLLRLFSHNISKSELSDIKRLLADYYVGKADEEMRHLQHGKTTSQADLDALLNSHLRTPYEQK